MTPPPPNRVVARSAPAPPQQVHAAPTLPRTGVANWRPWIDEASRRFSVPAAWISAVMRAESGGQLLLRGRPITSPAGAMGLMQLTPPTWRALRAQYRLGSDPYFPRDNIVAGAAYLRELYVRYGYPYLFAAYNAGPARLDAHLATGAPLPRETQAYLKALGQSDPAATANAIPPSVRAIFVAPGPNAGTLAAPRGADLFVPLTAAASNFLPHASARDDGDGLSSGEGPASR
jgi:soluble lytic murein transglycosylase-like protein